VVTKGGGVAALVPWASVAGAQRPRVAVVAASGPPAVAR
jgi:hypothetical protein